MIVRCILSKEWATQEFPNLSPAFERDLTEEQIKHYNDLAYNIYIFPNSPEVMPLGRPINGTDINKFNYLFVDFDLKTNTYPSKEAFIEHIKGSPLIPSFIVDSGNGVHAYFQVSDLDALSYLHFQRRLARFFNTDLQVSKIAQLMRLPGTINTKHKDAFKPCLTVFESPSEYTSEQLDKTLPLLIPEDEEYCKSHYDMTYHPEETEKKVSVELPPKFGQFLTDNQEAKSIWIGNTDDRSESDFRLGHLMFAYGFTKEEAMSVLVNAAKALSRAPRHRVSYAEGIVSKIWTFENTVAEPQLTLSNTVAEILQRSSSVSKDIRFPCHKYVDNTKHGFRLGNVIGLVGGSGTGKSAVALNFFEGFVSLNPDYDHVFVSLEQPANEIAERWALLCKGREGLNSKVHVMSNYEEDGSYRHLSFKEIQDYILKLQAVSGKKIGAVVIDHIGALRKKGGRMGENQDLIDICHGMKAFAIQTNTLLMMQSQAPREKAGIGDIELDKNAAFGTVFFESYCDYLITLWQPLKRVYITGAPTVTAFKFCKIRHKNQILDAIKEDTPYRMFFEPDTGRLRELTQAEETSFEFFLTQAANKRKMDKKTDILQYTSASNTDKIGVINGEANINTNLAGAKGTGSIPQRQGLH